MAVVSRSAHVTLRQHISRVNLEGHEKLSNLNGVVENRGLHLRQTLSAALGMA